MSRQYPPATTTALLPSDETLNPKVSVSAFDLLLIELVPLAHRLHADLLARHRELVPQADLARLFGPGGGSGGGRRRQQRRRDLAGGPQGGGGAQQQQQQQHGRGSGARMGMRAGVMGGGDDAGSSDGGHPPEHTHRQQEEVVEVGLVRAAAATAEGATGLGIDGGAMGQQQQQQQQQQQPQHGGGPDTIGGTGVGGAEDEDEDESVRDAVFYRLETQGYRVGQGLTERFSADQPRPTTDLDKIKFICKDLWTRVFRKQIDNLKTNHRGTFVLTDSRFSPLSRMSVDRKAGIRGLDQALSKAQAFLWFPCGIIRGALQSLGMDVTVNAETTDLPMATFQIRVVGAKP